MAKLSKTTDYVFAVIYGEYLGKTGLSMPEKQAMDFTGDFYLPEEKFEKCMDGDVQSSLKELKEEGYIETIDFSGGFKLTKAGLKELESLYGMDLANVTMATDEM